MFQMEVSCPPVVPPFWPKNRGGAGITGGEVQQGGTFFFGKEAKFFFNGFAGMKNFPGEVQQGGTTRGGGGHGSPPPGPRYIRPTRVQVHLGVGREGFHLFQ